MILVKEYIHSVEVKPSYIINMRLWCRIAHCSSRVEALFKAGSLLYNKGRKGAKTSET